jgi:hypothetical protein
MTADSFANLLGYLARVPAVEAPAASGSEADGGWWVKFSIDIRHPLAWHVVQEFAHVLNYMSVDERLPTAFKPVSPPPYLNGGPDEFLAWVIEAEAGFGPSLCAEWLEGRLPRPVDDENKWKD